ncbi:MAG: 16S rRNA (adenine(1518)-N(6)/adenine(1519)-N(6))-dimethyltransferase RsmA [Candidatus Acidiferrales bacterium]
MARQRLGQHFLGSESWRAKIHSTLHARTGEVWIEIGAGHGEMTEALARAAGRVIAIETDPRLAEELRRRAAKWPNVEAVEADVLKVDFASIAGGSRFRVYGNLPYYITSPILHHLFESADWIHSIHIVIQFEVAARIAAIPGSRTYAYLSAFCHYYSHPEIVMRIPPGAFRPPPKVNSALVGMRLPGERAALGITKERQFLKFIQECFEQKRKTLRNNLRVLVSAQRADAALSACGLRADARAEQLDLQHFADLFQFLFG